MKSSQIAAVYIMANRRRTVLYTGVTSDLQTRVWQHKTKHEPHSFTARYNVDQLVYFGTTANIAAAIAREKQIKSGSRASKVALIEAANPEWRDLSEGWYGY
jgi:putative endonuclease